MYKKIYILLLPILFSGEMRAQQLVNNFQCTTSAMANLANAAQIDIDALAINPAGASYYSDGLNISFGGIYFQHSVIEENKYNLREIEISRVDEQKMRLISPSIQIAYKNKNWSLSAYCVNNGGFGHFESTGSGFYDEVMDFYYNLYPEIYSKCDEIYENSLYENRIARSLTLLLEGAAPPIPDISESSVALAGSAIKAFAYQTSYGIGASYKINHISFYLGAKLNSLKWESKVNNSLFFINKNNGQMVSLEEYYACLSEFYKSFTSLSPEIAEPAQKLADNYSKISETASQLPNSDIMCNKLVLAPVLGIDYLSDRFNVALRYEMGIRNKGYFLYPNKFSLGLDYYWSNNFTSSFSMNVLCGSADGFLPLFYTSNPKASLNREFCVGLRWMPTVRTAISVSGGYGVEDMLLFNGMFHCPPQKAGICKLGAGLDFQVTKSLSFRFAGMYSFLPNNNVKPFSVVSGYKYTINPSVAFSAGFVVAIK